MGFFSRVRSRITSRFSKPKPAPAPSGGSSSSSQPANQSTPPKSGGTQTLRPTSPGGGSSGGGGGSTQAFLNATDVGSTKQSIAKPSDFPTQSRASASDTATQSLAHGSDLKQSLATREDFARQSFASRSDVRFKENVQTAGHKKFSRASLEQFASERTTKPVFRSFAEIGLTPRSVGDAFGKRAFPKSPRNIVIASAISPGKPFEETIKPSREFASGFISGTLEDVRDQPVKNVALFGSGKVVGIGFKAGAVGLALIPGTTGNIARGSSKVLGTTGGLGLGGLFAFQTGKGVIEAPTSREAGGFLGTTIKDASLFGAGAVSGSRGFTSRQIERGGQAFRNIGRTTLTAEEVVAPEFFKGQEFPQIKKGQSAQQLKDEFSIPTLPGEEAGVGRGFSATGIAFPTKTITQRGSSEVPGLFSAPKVSPHFLRLGGKGEQPSPSLFGSGGDLFNANLPTVLRIKFNKFGLAPGVKPSQTTPGKFNKKFFEKIEGTGETAIPFAKTEKEAVTAFGSRVQKTRGKFNVEIDNVKIPIDEFKILDGATNPIRNLNLGIRQQPTIGSISGRSSSGRISRPSIINPFSVSGSSLISGRRGSIRSSLSSSSFSNLSSPFSSVSSRGSSSSSSSVPSFTPPSSPFSPSGSSSSGSPFEPSSPFSPIGSSRSPFRRTPPPPRIPRVPKGKKKLSKRKDTGYFAYAKPVKGKKYVKLNRVPVTRDRALDIGTFFADNSLSTNFRIEKTSKKKGKSKLGVPKGYASLNIGKFRDYKIRKGKRVPLKNKYIEKKGVRRLDTRGEINKITVLNLLAKRRGTTKKKSGKKKKK